MATVTKGKTFTSTEEVTAAKLHTLVDSATVTAIAQADIAANLGLVTRSASAPSDTDSLHYDTSNNCLKAYDGSAWRHVPTTGTNEQGDVLYHNGTVWANLAHGTAKQSLLTGGDSANPAWGNVFVDRGDPAAYDFTEASLTMDGNFHDLDLSSIVPAGAVAVVLNVEITDNTVGASLQFRKNGTSNARTRGVVYIQVANVKQACHFIVCCDTNRVIEYAASEAIADLDMTVMGWIF